VGQNGHGPARSAARRRCGDTSHNAINRPFRAIEFLLRNRELQLQLDFGVEIPWFNASSNSKTVVFWTR
jgi:hypothetical protein